jgi:hypothetical protein
MTFWYDWARVQGEVKNRLDLCLIYSEVGTPLGRLALERRSYERASFPKNYCELCAQLQSTGAYNWDNPCLELPTYQDEIFTQALKKAVDHLNTHERSVQWELLRTERISTTINALQATRYLHNACIEKCIACAPVRELLLDAFFVQDCLRCAGLAGLFTLCYFDILPGDVSTHLLKRVYRKLPAPSVPTTTIDAILEEFNERQALATSAVGATSSAELE